MIWAAQIQGRIDKRQQNGKGKQALKSSTWRDYKSIMNHHVLPWFGKIPIRDITPDHIEDFTDNLDLKPKRINNILIPVRSIFDMALRKGLIQKNIMSQVKRLPEDACDIYPLNNAEVQLFLENVMPHFVPIFTVAFYTGMRFGEMAALKWSNVWFQKSLIRIRETRLNNYRLKTVG
jgi:integrase